MTNLIENKTEQSNMPINNDPSTQPQEQNKGPFEAFLENEIQDAFHDKHGNAYLTVDINGLSTTFAVDSQECEDFL